MKKGIFGMLIVFMIVIGLTHPVGPGAGGQITPLTEHGVGGL